MKFSTQSEVKDKIIRANREIIFDSQKESYDFILEIFNYIDSGRY
jgi:hypothetical protein